MSLDVDLSALHAAIDGMGATQFESEFDLSLPAKSIEKISIQLEVEFDRSLVTSGGVDYHKYSIIELQKSRTLLEMIYWRCSDDNLVKLPLGRTITSVTNIELYNLIIPHMLYAEYSRLFAGLAKGE